MFEQSGWKTKTGGVALMVSGVGMICTGIAGILFWLSDASEMDFEAQVALILGGVAAFGQGLSQIGLGHKQERVASKM